MSRFKDLIRKQNDLTGADSWQEGIVMSGGRGLGVRVGRYGLALGVAGWGLGLGFRTSSYLSDQPNPQPPITTPQSPSPNPSLLNQKLISRVKLRIFPTSAAALSATSSVQVPCGLFPFNPTRPGALTESYVFLRL